MKAPKTFLEAVRYFSDADACLHFLIALRWPRGVTCPRCGSKKVTFLEKAKLWKCKNAHPKQKFSVKVGTIFEDSPIGLEKWFPAMWLAANCKNGISSYELHRCLGVTQKTAWFMLQRIRLAMQKGGGLFKGKVEVDETFIGGRARKMNAKRRVHTNGLENFWSLLKRGLGGTYVSVEPFQLFRYLDEQAFRFNERKDDDAGRFAKALRGIVGKGLRYAKLIGGDGIHDPSTWQTA